MTDCDQLDKIFSELDADIFWQEEQERIQAETLEGLWQEERKRNPRTSASGSGRRIGSDGCDTQLPKDTAP